MQFFIGLDGGGTGCRARAVGADGRQGAIVEGGSANVNSDPHGAISEINRVLRDVMAAEGLTDPTDPKLHVVLGLAGASETGAAQTVKRALPFRNMTVLGDIDIALRGAFQDHDGIVLAVGTGSVVARQKHGQMHRVGGHGFLLGDEGSGAWIGRRAMTLALHALDGLCSDAPLSQALWARFGTVAAMLDFAGPARPADFASLAPQVVTLDKAGCAMARAILDESCAYLLRAIRLLQAEDTRMPVAAMGGLGPLMLNRLSAIASPPLVPATPIGTALDGALWIARQSAAPTGTTS